MNDTVYELLKRLKEKYKKMGIEHDYVFTNSKGQPYSEQGYKRAFKNACEKAGIKNFRFHDLRHTFASWLAIKSRDIYAVQKLLNHSNPQTTKRYAHLTEEYLKSVVNMLNFGSFSANKDEKKETA